MKQLRFRRRWAQWWVTAIVVSHYAALVYFFGGALQNGSNPGRTSGLRIMFPLIVVAGYWTLASVFNSYQAIVRPSGVRVTLFPFPTGSGQLIPREEIATCYGRRIVFTTEEGWESDPHYTAGIETSKGHQVDIHSRYRTEDEALAAAREISRVLNANPGDRPIQARLVGAAESFPTLRRQTLLWGMIILIALAVGFAWERTWAISHIQSLPELQTGSRPSHPGSGILSHQCA